jgi:23S rRNA (guanine745-N1)-methyltransferase
MILVRREFLATELYKPLRDAIKEAALRYYKSGNYLDAGCGEGYYTKELGEALGGEVYGIDISKDALRYAAKQIKNGSFAVASAYSLPFSDDSFSLITAVFSPLAEKEFKRVLTSDGTLIMAIPGRYHLFGLKSVLYDKPYENTVMPYDIEGFEFLESIKVDYELKLDRINAEKLFKMTPYYYRTPKAGRERLLSMDEVLTPISFEVLCYKNIKD